MDIFANGFNLSLFLDMLRRRIWIAIVLFAVVITAGASFLSFLPNIYTATAVLRVEGQAIPAEFVRPTVTMGAERRFQFISKELLSRTRLEKFIREHGLYPDLQLKGTSSEDIVAAMRQDILLRRYTGGEKEKDSLTFEVSYTNRDPETAMLVANRLASLYVEENVKIRERLSSGTTDFLQQQLEEAKQRLENREQKIMLYKRQNLGELPEQLEANFRTLDMLQKQLETISDNITEARERKSLLARRAAMDAVTNASPNDSSTAEEKRPEGLPALQSQLVQLRTHLSDRHPDVVRLRRLIATLEKDEQRKQLETVEPDTHPSRSPLSSTPVAQDEDSFAIQRLLADLHKVNQEIAVYKKRIENTGKREQELYSLTRDYETTRDLHKMLLKRYEEARMADDMEKDQRAERFSLIEPAAYPKDPSAPKRTRLFLYVLALSLGLAIGGVFLRDMLDSSFHHTDDLKKSIDVPLLIEIPQIVTNKERYVRYVCGAFGIVALTAVLLFIVNASYRIANGNEQLVRMLGIQRGA